jgi:pimeloyl-ACP methyl ester carboxylesterase
MKKIFLRSPYTISINEVGQIGSRVELFIWNANMTEPTIPSYTMSKKNVSPTQTENVFNISNKAIEFIENNGSAAFFKTAIPNLFHPLFQQQHPEMIEQLLQQSSLLRDEVVIAYYRSMIHRPDRTDVLRHSKFPVLIFIGSSDKAVHPDDALQQATLPAICQVELLEGVAHMGMWEAVNQLNQSLLLFLEMTYDR